jgi:hypothetical protein
LTSTDAVKTLHAFKMFQVASFIIYENYILNIIRTNPLDIKTIFTKYNQLVAVIYIENVLNIS